MRGRREGWSGVAWWITAACALAATAAMLHALWPFTVDDTFITLRYARHLAAGLGPVWNAGPVHDEGYSSPLWTLLLALPHLWSWDGEHCAKALSVLAYFGSVLACGVLSQLGVRGSSVESTRLTWIAPLLYLIFPTAAVHAISGMETAAFTLAITLLAALSASALQPGAPLPARRLAVLALLCGLLRPEGNIAAAVMFGTLAAMIAPAERARLLRAVLLLWVAPGAAYFVWRWQYHGELLPLPFYLKVAGVTWLAGSGQVLGYLRTVALGIGVPLVAGLVWLPRPLRPAVLAALALLLFYLLPEHVMGFHGRYLAPTAPILFAVAGAGLVGASRWLARVGPLLARYAGALMVLVVAVCAASLLSSAPAVIADRQSYAAGLKQAHRTLAARLAQLPPGRLAISDAGIIPYRTDWPTLDLVGLNDRHIARTHDRSPASVLAFRPDVLVLASRDSARFTPFHWNPWEAPILAEAEHAGFQVSARYRFHERYWLWVLVDPRTEIGRRAGAMQ